MRLLVFAQCCLKAVIIAMLAWSGRLSTLGSTSCAPVLATSPTYFKEYEDSKPGTGGAAGPISGHMFLVILAFLMNL